MKDTLKDLIAGLKLWKVWSRLANREIQLSVKRTVLGPLWLIIHRIFFAVAFSFLGAILWGTKPGLNIDVLIGFMVFSTMIGYLQSANTALISTVSFADSGLPVSVRFLKPWAKEFQLSVLSGVVLLITSIATGTFGFSVIFLLIALTILMSVWGLGLMFAISPVALRFRDVAQIVTFASTILMFFSPIFWKIEDIKNKELAQNLLTYNPVADFIFVFRDLVNLGTLNSDYLMRGCIQTIVILVVGYLSFALTRRRIPYWS
jgi:ABC-type polysaccharide/polyol phosphate export permease